MLCVEMTHMSDTMTYYAPAAAPGASKARAARLPAEPAALPGGSGSAPHRPTPDRDRPPRGEPGPVYAGLLNSGGLSHFEPEMQARLHVLYSHVGRGEYDVAGRMLPPLIRDVVAFRDANAPFGPSHLARPLLLALSRLRAKRRGRRGAATDAPAE